jgi:NADH-quinone oxidoreductase subunit M
VHFPLLSVLIFLPLLGALALLLLPARSAPAVDGTRADNNAGPARAIGLAVSGVSFLLALVLWSGFDPHQTGFQFQDRADWVPGFGISYHVGLDGISLLFVVLTTLVTPLAMLAAGSVTTRVRDYVVAILALETTLLGLFSSLDFVLFYVFYEATLLPGSLMVGIWGGPKRVHASIKFFLFTFGGSLFMLLALLAMWHVAGTTDIPVLLRTRFAPVLQNWMFLGLVLAFGVKLPVFPLHAWLPDAYTEAPSSATAMLSGVLSKAGAYGLLRFAIGMTPDAAHRYAPVMIALGIAAVIYAAIIALAQPDMKRLVAYSSFSHMGLVLVGLFTLNATGIDGALFVMLSHGIIIAALFFALSMLSDRAGTREIAGFGGAAARMPAFASLLMLFAMANIGLPGTGSFVGELLVMIGAIEVGFWVALLSGTAMILGAVYMLVLYRHAVFEAVSGLVSTMIDLNGRERLVLVPLALITLWMGVYPSSFTRVFDPVVTASFAPHPAATAGLAPPAAARPG